MKTYKTPLGLFAIEEDGSQDHLIQSDWAPITKEQAEEVRRQPKPVPEDRRIGLLISQAQIELQASDRVAIRCAKAGKAYPSEWSARDRVLRDIVRNGAGAIPSAPDYPAGT